MSIQKELGGIPQLIEIKISTICLPKGRGDACVG
jgi:hypothetical protein